MENEGGQLDAAVYMSNHVRTCKDTQRGCHALVEVLEVVASGRDSHSPDLGFAGGSVPPFLSKPSLDGETLSLASGINEGHGVRALVIVDIGGLEVTVLLVAVAWVAARSPNAKFRPPLGPTAW